MPLYLCKRSSKLITFTTAVSYNEFPSCVQVKMDGMLRNKHNKNEMGCVTIPHWIGGCKMTFSSSYLTTFLNVLCAIIHHPMYIVAVPTECFIK